MKEALENAIKNTAKLAAETKSPIEALQFTQAALNATNALLGLSNIKN